MSSPPASKAELRRRHRAQRAALTPGARRDQSRDVSGHLRRLIQARGARRVGAYRAMGAELDLGPLLDGLSAEGVSVLYPRVEDGGLVFADAAQGFERSRFGVEEPRAAAGRADELELIVVPCVACDRGGVRLGFGAGHYDRFFAAHPALSARSVAALYRGQLVDRLPREPHDRPLAAMVTPDGVLEARARSIAASDAAPSP